MVLFDYLIDVLGVESPKNPLTWEVLVQFHPATKAGM